MRRQSNAQGVQREIAQCARNPVQRMPSNGGMHSKRGMHSKGGMHSKRGMPGWRRRPTGRRLQESRTRRLVKATHPGCRVLGSHIASAGDLRTLSTPPARRRPARFLPTPPLHPPSRCAAVLPWSLVCGPSSLPQLQQASRFTRELQPRILQASIRNWCDIRSRQVGGSDPDLGLCDTGQRESLPRSPPSAAAPAERPSQLCTYALSPHVEYTSIVQSCNQAAPSPIILRPPRSVLEVLAVGALVCFSCSNDCSG
jgi:hypothetical protein